MTTDYLPAIIIARGGSTRIPRKNIKPFCGKPLVAWSIEAAINSEYVSETYVSTDDDEIADISKDYGAKIIRRDHISDSKEVGTVAILNSMQYLKDAGYLLNGVVSLLPTCLCRLPGDIDRLISNWKTKKYKYSIFGYNPKELLVFSKLEGDEGVQIIFDKNSNYYSFISGDNVSTMEVVTQIWNYQKENKECFVNFLYGVTPIEQWQCQDVDTLDEWEVGEYWFKRKVIDVYGEYPYEGGRIA
jgi:CMP-N-acetylneuraminic acid synthetase